MELIRLEDIHKTYYLGEVDVPVLRGISLSIARGEMVALMGASGSGKTTLMNILGCLDRPTSGQYWLDGEEMSRLSPNQRALVRTGKLGFVFQSFNLLPRTTALQNVVMPLDYSPHRPPRGEARRLAQILLERVGLTDRADHEPSQMSGGQQQRVAVARSLVNRPALVLADEPTGNLDSHTSVEILRMFQQLNAEGITVILVTHDPHVAAYAHRVIRISDGCIEGDETHVPRVSDAHHANGGRFAAAPVAPSPALDGNGTAAASAQAAAATATVDGHVVRECNGHVDVDCDGAAVSTEPTAAMAVGAALDGHPAAHREPKGFSSKGSLYGDAATKSRRLAAPTLLPATFRTALGALRRNKMRSALTALGVIIGVGAVIAMMEIGQGSSKALQKTIASMGANIIMVFPGAANSSGVRLGTGTVQSLTPKDLDEILRQCPAVSDAAPLVRAWGAQIVYGHRNWSPSSSVIGTTPSFLAVRDWEDLEEGDVFTDRDVRNWNKVCLIGATIKRELFENESPVGKEIRIKNVAFRVIGVLGRKGANMMGQDQDDIVIAPWTTIKYRVSGMSQTANQAVAQAATTSTVNSLSNLYPAATPLYIVPLAQQAADTPQPVRFTNVDYIYVKAVTAERIPDSIEQVTQLLRERHHLEAGEDDDFQIRDMTEITKTLSSTSQLMGVLLLVVASISLVVGGVGIMNIMLVSVTERTREIGLRMAVGARSYHILRQFLVEAVVLCIFGGALGILLGRGSSLLVRKFLQWPTQISLPAIIAAVVVSVGVGVVFGFYPAWKASRLDPIEALRYE